MADTALLPPQAHGSPERRSCHGSLSPQSSRRQLSASQSLTQLLEPACISRVLVPDWLTEQLELSAAPSSAVPDGHSCVEEAGKF